MEPNTPKTSWAVERRPKRNPIKENPASNSTTKKHSIDFLSKQPSREWIWKNNKNVSEKQTKPTWAKEYMRQVLSDLGADHEWITSTSSISSFCSDIFFLKMMNDDGISLWFVCVLQTTLNSVSEIIIKNMVSVIKNMAFCAICKHNTRVYCSWGFCNLWILFFFFLWEQPLDSYAKRSVFLRT